MFRKRKKSSLFCPFQENHPNRAMSFLLDRCEHGINRSDSHAQPRATRLFGKSHSILSVQVSTISILSLSVRPVIVTHRSSNIQRTRLRPFIHLTVRLPCPHTMPRRQSRHHPALFVILRPRRSTISVEQIWSATRCIRNRGSVVFF